MDNRKLIAEVKRSNREYAKKLRKKVKILEKEYKKSKSKTKKKIIQNKLWELRSLLQRASTIGG